MLLQYPYYLFVKLSIIISCEMSCVLLIVYYYFLLNYLLLFFVKCVLLDSNIYVVKENQYMDNFFVFHYG